MIDAKQIQNRGMKIVYRDRLLLRLIATFQEASAALR